MLYINVYEIFGRCRTGRPLDKEHLIRFWDCSRSGSRINFFVLGSKHELKELWIDVYDTFWSVGLEQHWQRFELYECFLLYCCEQV